MDEILISTISPCFRMKRYLKQFLEELPKQTIFNKIEVILDHNEPDEEEIIWVKNFQRKYPNRLKHIIVDKVDPLGISMNRCIKESSGKFLAIWNIDDLRTNDSLELQYKKILEDDDCGVVYGDYIIVKSFGSQRGQIINCSTYERADLLRSMLLGPFFMFRKSLCDKVGYFDEQFKVCADFDFALRLLLNSKAVYVKSSLGFYLNEGTGSSTKPDSILPIEDNVIFLRYGIFDKLDYDLVVLSTQYNIKYVVLGENLIYIGDYIENYNDMIDRKKKLIKKGIRLFFYKRIIMYKKIKKFKEFIKKIIPIVILNLYGSIKILNKSK